MSLFEVAQSARRFAGSCGTGPGTPPSLSALSNPCDQVQLLSRYRPRLRRFSRLTCIDEKNELPELSIQVIEVTAGSIVAYGRRGSIAPGPGGGRLMLRAQDR